MAEQGALPPTSLDPVGVVGLGEEGSAVAVRLLAAGHTVFGYQNRPPEQAFLHAGGQACSTAAELADRCPAVLTVLPTAEALTEVINTSDGLGATTRQEGIWVEMSTVSEQSKRTAADRLARPGWHVLDCAVSGTPAQLGTTSAVIFSSGSRDISDQVMPVLQAVNPKVQYMGEFGAGIRAKYVAQLLLAAHSLVAAEALAFAQSAGLAPADILTAMAGTITSSNILEQRGPGVLTPLSAGQGHGRARYLAGPLNSARQIAVQAGMKTPVLDQALACVQALAEDSPDDLVKAFYQQLAPSGAAESQSRDTGDDT